MATFADIQIDHFFYMDMGGMNDVFCRKTSENGLAAKSPRGDWVSGKAWPQWEVKTLEEYQNEQLRKNAHRYIPVNGHSATWPYGEH